MLFYSTLYLGVCSQSYHLGMHIGLLVTFTFCTTASLERVSHTLKHVSIGIVSDGEDVWRHLCPPLSTVHVNHLW